MLGVTDGAARMALCQALKVCWETLMSLHIVAMEAVKPTHSCLEISVLDSI